MRANEPLHGGGLADALPKLVTSYAAEQRQVGLEQEAQTVAVIVDGTLHRMLGQAQKIQMGELGQQDVVAELVEISTENTLVEMAHGVGAAQPDFAPVQIKLPLGLRVFVLHEGTHSEGLARGIKHFVLNIRQGDLRLVEPGLVQFPPAGGWNRQGQ
jgi:hypothetical protein